MAIDWRQIQPFNGSQNNAFEELVCQLAREEFDKEGKFIRFGTPDGGLEAICKFDDGREYGWQAKYFLNVFNHSQWDQIEKSFKNAVTNYPELTDFFLCVPLDRNNPCVTGKESFRNKWDNKELEWQEWAKEQGRDVKITFWGSSELIKLLSKRDNVGRVAFWFKQTELSWKWFEDYNSSAIKNLGARYAPELNIELSISEAFEALARSKQFKTSYQENINNLINRLNYYVEDCIKTPEINEDIIFEYEKLIKLTKIEKENYLPLECIDVESILDCLLSFQEIIDSCIDNHKFTSAEEDWYFEDFLIELEGFENEVKGMCLSQINLFNNQVLWIEGEAGVGKSHLIADMIQRRYKRNKYSILLLGQHFTESANIWHQILDKILRIKTDSHQFLCMLETIADAQQERVIIAIDALNESNDRSLWIENLNGFIHDVLKHPKIGLVVSVRSSYQQLFIQNLSSEIKEKICFVKHDGFSECDFEAIEHFFDFYSLPYPTVPLLNREFSNPLYLKLYCETLKKQGAKSIPKGSMGIKQLINSYLDHLENNNAKRLGVRSSMHLVQKAINVIIESQLTSETLFYEDTRIAISTHLINFIPDTDAKNFIDYLLNEQLLNANLIDGSEIVYFTYERISDYLSAQYILQDIDNCAQFNQWLSLKLGEKLVDNFKSYKGLWEAISVLLPERLGVELFETLVWNKINPQNRADLINLIIANLPWRTPASIKPTTLIAFLNDNPNIFDQSIWIESLYQLAAEKENPLNADYLYKWLFPLSLADRDVEWSLLLQENLRFISPETYLFNWCKKYNNHDIDHDLLLLVATAITWLLSSCHISVRETAIQALAYLCWNRLHLASELFLKFAMVNDPYILEGILAAIETAVLNADNLADLRKLAETVDNRIFKVADGEEVYPNILVRDHARYIIEYSLLKDNYSETEKQLIQARITPPYTSFFPDKLPTNQEIKQKYSHQNEKLIIQSVMKEYEKSGKHIAEFGFDILKINLCFWRGQFTNKSQANLITNYTFQLMFEKFGYVDLMHKKSLKTSDVSIQEKVVKILEDNWYFIHREWIGRKYFFLAVYEVLAKLMDNYQGEKDKNIKWWDYNLYAESPCENAIRNQPIELKWITDIEKFIYPKLRINLNFNNKDNIFPQNISSIPKLNEANSWHFEEEGWMNDEFLWSQVLNLIELDLDGEKWLALNSEFRANDNDSTHNVLKEGKYVEIKLHSYLVKESEFRHAKALFNLLNYDDIETYATNTIFNRDSKRFLLFASSIKQELNAWFEYSNSRSKQNPKIKSVRLLPTSIKNIQFDFYKRKEEIELIPSTELYQKLGMNWSNERNCWLDSERQPVCVFLHREEEIPLLLINKEKLVNFLKENKLKIFWRITTHQGLCKPLSLFNKYKDTYGFYYLNLRAKNKPIIGEYCIEIDMFEPDDIEN